MANQDITKGISNEEEYFYKENKELIERMRGKLDSEKEKKASQEVKALHWMKCPKCGREMHEMELAGIKVDKCSECRGIYFDHGELEILIESKEPKGFLMKLRKLFH